MNTNTLKQLTDKLSHSPDTVEFTEVIETINEHFDYTPTRFTNGVGDNLVESAAGQNEGSCKIFAFAQQQQLTEEQTLHCFGQYYRSDVLQHPENIDHANIRNFMVHGWKGINFDNDALAAKE